MPAARSPVAAAATTSSNQDQHRGGGGECLPEQRQQPAGQQRTGDGRGEQRAASGRVISPDVHIIDPNPRPPPDAVAKT